MKHWAKWVNQTQLKHLFKNSSRNRSFILKVSKFCFGLSI